MKKTIAILVILAAAGGGGYAYYAYNKKPPEPTVTTLTVSRGSIIDSVGSTGQLSAVRQVPVGSQVPGKILALHADYNSIVKKDQLLAEIDPLTIQTQILQAKANLVRSETDVDRAKVQLADAQKKFERSKELSAKGIENRAAFDQAELNLASAHSSVKSSEASLLQSQASLAQQELNLTYTKIYAPIDGLVVSRQVDVGQTVSVSQSAPTIFNLVTDLTMMKVLAGVDETDVGRIRPQQNVTFRVDAYPNETFGGTVEQVRLESRMQQNVVTYQTVISVPNPELKLKPGMTANVNIEISRRNDVVRVPSAALRFRPTNDMYVALGLTPPPERGRGGPGGRQGAPATAGAPAPAGSATPAGSPSPRGGSTASPRPSTEGGRPAGAELSGRSAGSSNENGASDADRMARMQNRTPEELERMMAQRGGRGGGAAGGRGGNRGGGRGSDGRGRGGATGGRGGANAQNASRQGQTGRASARTATELAALRDVTSIDSLFPPLPPPESRGNVWLWDKDKKELKSVPLRLGVTDGQNSELLEGEVTEGTSLVSNIIIPQEVRPGFGGPQQGNPFLQQQRGRGPGQGGGNPGGGFNPGGGGGGNQGGGGNRGGGGGGGGGRGGF